MKKLFFALFLVGCSTMSNSPLANGQYIASYSDGFTADISVSISKVMAAAQQQCGSQKVKVVKMDNTQPMLGNMKATSTMIYECN